MQAAAVKAAKPAVSRVYVVYEYVAENDAKRYLVEAKSQAGAIAHIVKGRFEAHAASVADVIELKNTEIQKSGAE
jgi:hypothetical protein